MLTTKIFNRDTCISTSDLQDISNIDKSIIIPIDEYMFIFLQIFGEDFHLESEGLYRLGSVEPVCMRETTNRALSSTTHMMDALGYTITGLIAQALNLEFYMFEDKEVPHYSRFMNLSDDDVHFSLLRLGKLSHVILEALQPYQNNLLGIRYNSNKIILDIGMDYRAAMWLKYQTERIHDYESDLDRGKIDTNDVGRIDLI